MKQKLNLIAFFLCLFLMGYVTAINAQVKQDASGNYYAVKSASKDSATNTGKTFTDAKGVSYPVMQGKKGGLFIIRTSRNGNQYKQYLKID